MSDTEYRAEQIAAVAREMARLDLVNVVRCRDCKNKQPYDEPMGCDCLCGLLWIEVEPNGYCAWGERE